jgi:hypothetical protein
MNTVKERRREPRVTLSTPGWIDLGDHTVPCQTIDLSERGLGLLAPLSAPSQAVHVCFKLAENSAWTDVDARVVRRQSLANHLELWGLELCPMDLGTSIRISDYIRAKRHRSREAQLTLDQRRLDLEHIGEQ